jgi:hypothetical protein
MMNKRKNELLLFYSLIHKRRSSYYYFHSHTLDEVFPCSSDSYSNTPTKLLRKASFPFEDALKNNDPVNLIFPELVNLPTPCPTTTTSPLVASFFIYLSALSINYYIIDMQNKKVARIMLPIIGMHISLLLIL